MSGATTLQISLPKDFLALLGTQPQAVETVKEFIVLGLYLEGRISGGKSAEMLGLTRLGFVSLLARKGISYFNLTDTEWEDEVATVKTCNKNHA